MGLKTSRAISNTAIHILLIVISVVWLIPFVCIVLQSFRVEGTGPVGYIIPKQWGLDNYSRLFQDGLRPLVSEHLYRRAGHRGAADGDRPVHELYAEPLPLQNAPAADAVHADPGDVPRHAVHDYPVPGAEGSGLTQANAVPGLILVYIASSGMGYYVSKGFFDTIPMSLDEAARVDGATRAQVLYKIILPLSKPIVIYTILTAFMGPWGDYVFARYISFGTSAGKNVAVGLYDWLNKDQISSNYTMFCAGGVLVALPVTLLFMFLQRYYVEGVTGGAVKG